MNGPREIPVMMPDGSFRKFSLLWKWNVTVLAKVWLNLPNPPVVEVFDFKPVQPELLRGLKLTKARVVVSGCDAVWAAEHVRVDIWNDNVPLMIGLVPGFEAHLAVPAECMHLDTKKLLAVVRYEAGDDTGRWYGPPDEVVCIVMMNGTAVGDESGLSKPHNKESV
jgi:hypothetical protein